MAVGSETELVADLLSYGYQRNMNISEFDATETVMTIRGELRK